MDIDIINFYILSVILSSTKNNFKIIYKTKYINKLKDTIINTFLVLLSSKVLFGIKEHLKYR